jgi:predicted molibdopterin-dependent oxidoreductase YjgC
MFARLPELAGTAGAGDEVIVTIDGVACAARTSDTVAVAMLLAGHHANRSTAVTGAPRGPWCLMGTCFDCLVTIDGVPSQQACMRRVAAQMRIETQHGARRVERAGVRTDKPER